MDLFHSYLILLSWGKEFEFYIFFFFWLRKNRKYFVGKTARLVISVRLWNSAGEWIMNKSFSKI